MIIPIKTFEEMNETERREYLEGLIEDYVLADQDGNGVSPEEFINEVPIDEILKIRKHRTRRPKAKDRDYFTRKEIAEKTGRHPDTIGRLFWNDPGVLKQTHSGRNRRTYVTMLISKAAAKRRFPALNI
jgi:hypothetical protein